MRRKFSLVLVAGLASACGQYEVVDVGGVDREFLLHEPPGEAPPEGWPLVVAFHGAYSTPEQTEDYTSLSALADDEGFIVAYPKGKQRLWNDGRLADTYDDVAFTRTMVDHLVSNHGVDESRVYATGISNGGFMSHRVGCELAERISAIAPVAASISEELVETCDPAAPMPVMLFMGTDDSLVPFEGGQLGGGATGRTFGTMLSAEASAEYWAGLNGCAGEASETSANAASDATTLRTSRYDECDEGALVVLHAIEGGGHTWPGAEHVPGLGEVSRELHASVDMWRFFEAVSAK